MNFLKKLNDETITRRLEAVTAPRQDCQWFDGVVMIYVATVLLFQILFQISPVVTFLAKTPLYSIQTYLGLLGGGLIVVDLFTTKKIWQGKYSWLLYAILALAAVASVRMIGYGVKENLFKLCWMAVQFVLVYSCALRMKRGLFLQYAKILFASLLAVWLVACCVSLYQYLYQIRYLYVVNPLGQDASANRQGFYDNRLFGIFYTLNHAAYISLIFLVFAVFWAIKTKHTWLRFPLGLAGLILLSYILLTSSRSAHISLLVCTFCGVWMFAQNRFKKKVWISTLVAVTAVVALAVCLNVYEAGLEKLPHWWYYNIIATDPDHRPGVELPDGWTSPSVPPEDDLLHREDLEEDQSNGRMDIWKDYISLYDKVGLVGLSPGNYMPYILENCPDLYIVEYIRQYYPDKYASGIIYHVHSGYMMVYVSAGLLGLGALAAFVLLFLRRIIRVVIENRRLSSLFICAGVIVVAGAISAIFDEGLFFQNNPQTTFFWLALGVLAKEAAPKLTV